MKLRESGMPPQDYWETLHDVPRILDAFGFGATTGDVAELGCGYGTFTIPLAARIGGQVHAFDIDAAMVGRTRRRAAAAGLANVHVRRRDVFSGGYGMPDASCEACLLFNILHGESPVGMLRAAARVVRPDGLVAIIHWRGDIATPRGPSSAIRPAPEQIAAWADEAGGFAAPAPAFPLPPWHFGLRLVKSVPGSPGPELP